MPTSDIEKERKDLLQQLNNLSRRLENVSPRTALELNEKLRLLVDWLAKQK
jgi:hypothetical protein